MMITKSLTIKSPFAICCTHSTKSREINLARRRITTTMQNHLFVAYTRAKTWVATWQSELSPKSRLWIQSECVLAQFVEKTKQAGIFINLQLFLFFSGKIMISKYRFWLKTTNFLVIWAVQKFLYWTLEVNFWKAKNWLNLGSKQTTKKSTHSHWKNRLKYSAPPLVKIGNASRGFKFQNFAGSQRFEFLKNLTLT